MNDTIKKIVGILIGLFLGGGAIWIASVDSRSFDSPEQKVKHINHVNEVPSDVETYKREVQLISQQEILIKQTAKMDSIYGFAIKTLEKDSIKELKISKSRAGRDSTNKRIDLKLDFIIKKLDTIN